jgi:hypothetical protein
MPRITICPRCTSHLELPRDLGPAAQVQCPICEVEFSLATAAPRELPQARIIEREAAEAGAKETPQLSPQERLSQLIRATAAPAAGPHVETEFTESYDDAYEDADPELAAPKPPQEELQLGSSRLDQLLSDLIKTPAPPSAGDPVPTTTHATSAATSEAELHLDKEFAADLEDDEVPYASSAATAEAEEPEESAEEVAVPAIGDEGAGEELPATLRTTPRRKRRPSAVPTWVGVIGGGALGILLGAYGLLWLRGPDGDFLGLARVLPSSMLPTSMLPPTTTQADDDGAYVDRERGEPDELNKEESSLAGVERSPLRYDSAVAPATAEEPISDAEADPAVGDVVTAAPETPPPTLADPPAKPHTWPTTPIVADLRGVKLYSVAQLDELIPAADKAHREFLAGDLSREESWSTMGPAYMTLASLAERYTLIDPAQYGNDFVAKQIEAKEIFRGLVGDPARRADVSTVAARWLQHERRLNQGVIIVGRVRDLRPQGKWTEYIVDVPLGDSAVEAFVLMDRIRFSAGDEIAVVGAILPRPVEQLADYEGDASQRVVAGWAFTPEDFKAPSSADAGQLPFETSAGGQ